MSTINVEKHETGAFFKKETVTSLNICKLKNGNTAIGLNDGDSSLIFEFDDEIKNHLVSLLNITPNSVTVGRCSMNIANTLNFDKRRPLKKSGAASGRLEFFVMC